MLKKIVIRGGIIGLLLGVAGYIALFVYLPSHDSAGEMTQEAIMKNLKSETVVYYSDEESQLGSFFLQEHRRYVTYDSIPKAIIHGLVAGEDQDYFKHEGVDPKGIGRALLKTVTTGQKQGGSTLTQQAAKNLFGLYKRTIFTKIKELMYTKKLEYFFTKEQILEFYLNQFYVSGTGRGVNIAAKYFFNKQLSDLTLRECAFIAGSVKGPSNYDPFIKRSLPAKEQAIKRGYERSDYILARMKEEGYIDEIQYTAAMSDSITFAKGNFKSSLTTPMEWVNEQMQSDKMQAILTDAGLIPWEEAQLTIITTLRKEFQESALSQTRDNMSRMHMLLEGYANPDKSESSKYSYTTKGEFGYGRVDSLKTKEGAVEKVYVSMGQVHGAILKSELRTFAQRVLQHKSGGGVALTPQNESEILRLYLFPGAIIYIQTLKVATAKSEASFSIETVPEVQGASYLVKKGEIQAAINGFNNTGYDRIDKANRQFGSAWKPLLYAAALENGWNYMDLLENKNNVFQYSKNFYFPNPDHLQRGSQVSLTWAATRSENIASIYLLTHLLEKLSHAEFWKHAEQFRFAQKSGESIDAYTSRLQSSRGILLNNRANLEIRFAKAKELLGAELTFAGADAQAEYLKHMACGHDFSDQYPIQRNADTKKFLLNNYLNHLAAQSSIDKQDVYHSDSLQLYSVFSQKPDASWKKVTSHTVPIDSLYINGGIQKVFFDTLISLVGSPLSKEELVKQENLRYLPDFTIGLSIEVFIDFCRRMGITQSLNRVLSMPLGANDIHLSDITHAYESILTGKQYKGSLTDWGKGILIKKVIAPNGDVLFENKTDVRTVYPDTLISQMRIMLRSVIENGTGKYADRVVSVVNRQDGKPYRYPIFGKTGTTNSFKNAAFIGGIAGWDAAKDNISMSSGYTLGTYVGYDDNKPMISKALRASGSSGALPQWAQIAQEILVHDTVRSHIDFLDFELVIAGKITPYDPYWGPQKQVSAMTGIFTNSAAVSSDSSAYIYTYSKD